MSRMAPKEVVCGVCGKTVEVFVVLSTSELRGPDLDLRPPPMRRNTIHSWVTQCPSCGYAARNIEEGFPGAAELLMTPAYRESDGLKCPYPRNDKFVKAALLSHHRGNLSQAAECYLFAAWCADDALEDGGGRDWKIFGTQCRRRAAALYEELWASYRQNNRVEGRLCLRLADIHRRLGDFDRAAALCEDAQGDRVLQQNPPALAMARYAEALCLQKDATVHTLDEAIRWQNSQQPPK